MVKNMLLGAPVAVRILDPAGGARYPMMPHAGVLAWRAGAGKKGSV
jgi:hypothetical protein